MSDDEKNDAGDDNNQDDDNETPQKASSSKAVVPNDKKKFEVKKWNAVALWGTAPVSLVWLVDALTRERLHVCSVGYCR